MCRKRLHYLFWSKKCFSKDIFIFSPYPYKFILFYFFLFLKKFVANGDSREDRAHFFLSKEKI